ncbi:MAG: 30S ribosomal protein S11 [Kiritimatiellia bacterium]|jgi:small subunit ribosomal protein S11
MSEEEVKKTEKTPVDASAESSVETDAMAIVMGDDGQAAAAPTDAKGKKRVRTIPAGIVHITASFNNTQCCITDARGNVIAWSSSGKAGFKGSRKSTAFAGTMVAQECARTAMAKGMNEVEVRVQGAGAGRESAIRAIASAGMAVTLIKDITPIPHNGCRQRKRRRV